jgi:hypothetical protein
MPAAVNVSIKKAAVASSALTHRCRINGPRTGATKPSVPRKILASAALEGNLTLLIKLLQPIICFSTTRLERLSIYLILIIGIYLKIFMRHYHNTLHHLQF